MTARERADDFFDTVYDKGAECERLTRKTVELLLLEHEAEVRREAFEEAAQRVAKYDVTDWAQLYLELRELADSEGARGDSNE